MNSASSLPPLPPHAIVTAIKNSIRWRLTIALDQHVIKSSNNTKEIIKIFRTQDLSQIQVSHLKSLGYVVDFPNKVFREVNDLNVIPSTPAVGLIITNNIVDTEGIDKLYIQLFDQPVGSEQPVRKNVS